MTAIDLTTYLPLFISTVKDSLVTMENNFNLLLSPSANPDQQKVAYTEIHRMFHTVKGRALFMGFQQTGQYCLLLEKIFFSLKENRLSLSVEQMTTLAKSVKVLSDDLVMIEQQQKETDLSLAISNLENFSRQLI